METPRDRRSFVKLTAAGSAALALAGGRRSVAAQDQVESRAQETSSVDEPAFFQVVNGRRSVRKFLPTPVPDEDLLAILDAARAAPTSGNQQPWKFLVLRDRDRLEGLRDACIERSMAARRLRQGAVSEEEAATTRRYYEDYLSAPVYVVILTDNESQYPTYNHWDGPLAAGYLMLAARALGYGTVFCTDSIPPDITKEVLNIPDRYTRVCITPIGVPEEWPESPPKKPLEEFIAYEEV